MIIQTLPSGFFRQRRDFVSRNGSLPQARAPFLRHSARQADGISPSCPRNEARFQPSRGCNCNGTQRKARRIHHIQRPLHSLS